MATERSQPIRSPNNTFLVVSGVSGDNSQWLGLSADEPLDLPSSASGRPMGLTNIRVARSPSEGTPSSRSADEAIAMSASEGSGDGAGAVETQHGPQSATEDELDTQDATVLELLGAEELQLDGDVEKEGESLVSDVMLDEGENVTSEQLFNDKEATDAPLSTTPTNTAKESTKNPNEDQEVTFPPQTPQESSTTGLISKESSYLPTASTATAVTGITAGTVPAAAEKELLSVSVSMVTTSVSSIPEPTPSTTDDVATETVETDRSSEPSPSLEKMTATVGLTSPTDASYITSSEGSSTFVEDVGTSRSAGVTTSLTVPPIEQTGDTAPPWTPQPSFEQPTGRPLRKSSRRGDPDIHTVLDNILSIIGSNVRVRGQPAPSLRPPARGNNRINNRGPPQFVAGTGPGPAALPPPRPLIGGLPPTQVAPPLRTKTTVPERVRVTVPSGSAGGATVSPTPVLTSSASTRVTASGSGLSQPSVVSTSAPARTASKTQSSDPSEGEETSPGWSTTVGSPAPTKSTDPASTTADTSVSSSSSATTTSFASPTTAASTTLSGDQESETQQPENTEDDSPSPSDPTAWPTKPTNEPMNPTSESTDPTSEVADQSNEPTVPSEELTDPTMEVPVTSLSAMLGTSADPATASPEEERPTRPFIPSRPSSSSVPLTSRPRRPLRPASSSRPASLFERLRESLKPTAAGKLSPSQRRPPPSLRPFRGTTPRVTTITTTGTKDTTVSGAGVSAKDDMMVEESLSTLSTGTGTTEETPTTQMEVQTSAPWEVSTTDAERSTTPSTTEDFTSDSGDFTSTAGSAEPIETTATVITETQQPTDMMTDDTTTAASADTSPPPAPASLGVGTAVAVSPSELIRPASPPSRWPNGRPGMTGRPRPRPPPATPPLAVAGRPGLVLDAAAPHRPEGLRPGHRRPEPVILTAPTPAVGDVIDVTVSAVQELGARPPPPPSARQPTRQPTRKPAQPSASTGQPYVIPGKAFVQIYNWDWFGSYHSVYPLSHFT